MKKSNLFQLDFKYPKKPNAIKLSNNSIEKNIAKIMSNLYKLL